MDEIKNCRFLFLDRDGVINKLLPDDYVKTWDEFEFKQDFKYSISFFSKHFDRIFIITNQRGVGRGLMTEEDLLNVHNRMIFEIENMGGKIDKIYYCTATYNEHPDRKPNIGMGLKAKKDFPEVDFNVSVMIGDSKSDIQFGKNLSMKTISIHDYSLIQIMDFLKSKI